MLREETVEPGTLGLLKKLVALPELKKFRLVGGTALSLLYGHRKSIDLDLFTDTSLDKAGLVEALEYNFTHVEPTNDRFKSIYQCIIENVKVDFVCVKDPFIYPAQVIDNIPFADTRELIALKLNAIKGRGVKKDFWDLAKLLQLYTFNDLFKFYNDRYPYDDTFAVIRSTIYFEDAEDTLEPESMDDMTWAKAKKIIKKAFEDYYRN